jgi:hypothetical protein
MDDDGPNNTHIITAEGFTVDTPKETGPATEASKFTGFYTRVYGNCT